ncbi:MAG: hypothetical protein KDA61_08210 [Planctomycetales bacterium]|nr:hypothetical protein [Planctomycetales bacterium]
MNFSTTLGGIAGSQNATVIPAIDFGIFGTTPAVTADTRTGAKLTTSLNARAGIELSAGVTYGGAQFAPSFEAGPTLVAPGPVATGNFFSLAGSTNLGANSNFNPGLPKFDAGLDVILRGDFNNRLEYGLFPFVPYDIGDWNLPFDFSFDLFDIDFDLNLPRIPIPDFPSLPVLNFNIPASEQDDTVFRQKLPPRNALLSFGEIALSNPAASLQSASTSANGKPTFTAQGSLMRAGLDLDGIATGLATGFSFTGTSVSVGPAKFSYDIIDLKYGLELGMEYTASIDPRLNATLQFDKPVLLRNPNGTTQTVTSYSGRWDQLPQFALLSREDVQVDVDFTGVEATFDHEFFLTLSDYMEFQALKASASVGPLNIFDFGPLYYQRFPIAGELARLEIPLGPEFSLGTISLPSGVWDGSFTLQSIPITEVVFSNNTQTINSAGFGTRVGAGEAVDQLTANDLLIFGVRSNGTPQTRLDISPLNYVDPGGSHLAVAGLVVPESSSYRLAAGSGRSFTLETLQNDGLVAIAAGASASFDTPSGLAQPLDIFTNASGRMLVEGEILIESDSIRHGANHSLLLSSRTSGAANGRIVATNAFENRGDIRLAGADAQLAITSKSFANYADIAVSAGNLTVLAEELRNFDAEIAASSGATINFDHSNSILRVENTGQIRATGPGTRINFDDASIQAPSHADAPGRIVAEAGAEIVFLSRAYFTRQTIVAETGGSIRFDGEVRLFRPESEEGAPNAEGNVLRTEVGGVLTLAGGLGTYANDAVNIENYGTLEILDDVSLIPTGFANRDGPPPIVVPIDLINAGTINIRNGANFHFGVRIENFANNGANLADGVWNLIGPEDDYSNLDTGFEPSSITIEVLEVVPDDQILRETYGLSITDTALKGNYASVQLHGRASFPYFNTIERNEGEFTISGGHQFTTAGGYTNLAGSTMVESGGDLFVQGPLRVLGGSVTVGAGSTFTALTETEILDDGSMVSRTVEVVGGELRVAEAASFNTSPMLSARPWSGPNAFQLNAGQTWIVREQVATDMVTQIESVTPSVIDLAEAIIERNDGAVVAAGGSASFDAILGMRINAGDLTLESGFSFDSNVDRFTNVGQIALRGARFMSTSSDALFLNSGNLTMDGTSRLKTGRLINQPGGTIELDGLIEAEQVVISRDSSIVGSGMIIGEVINVGLMDIGNSPGHITFYNDLTLGANSVLQFEIEGMEAGDSYDQIVVNQFVAAPGEPAAPVVNAALAGSVELSFSDELSAIPGTQWLLMDLQGTATGGFDKVLATGLASPPIDSLALPSPLHPTDLLLGLLGESAVYFTTVGGDGNDVLAYSLSTASTFVLQQGYAVDGNDFLAWQRSPDLAAIADWQRQFGSLSGIRNSTSVPEPTAGLMLLLGLSAFVVNARTGRSVA